MDITKAFDIQVSPKTAEELESLRKHYTKYIRILLWGTSLMVLALIGLVGYFYNLLSTHASVIEVLTENQSQLFLIISSGAILSVFAFNIFPRIFLREQENSLSLLQPITPDHAPDIITWSESYPVIAAYQNKIAAQGRSPVKIEYETMKIWIESGKQAEEQKAKEKVAYEKLLKPIAYKGENQ